MKKKILFYVSVSLIILAMFLFFRKCSCSTKKAEVISVESLTIRQEVQQQYNTVSWMEEIHPQGLQPKTLTKSPVLPPAGLEVLYSGTPIYPYLEGFGSLDTSALPQEVLDLLDLFFSMAALPEKSQRSIDKDLLTPDLDFLPVVLKYHFLRLHPVTRTIYGEALVLENGFQIPVRFQNENQYTDANLFVSQKDLSYVIDQIQFATAITKP